MEARRGVGHGGVGSAQELNGRRLAQRVVDVVDLNERLLVDQSFEFDAIVGSRGVPNTVSFGSGMAVLVNGETMESELVDLSTGVRSELDLRTANGEMFPSVSGPIPLPNGFWQLSEAMALSLWEQGEVVAQTDLVIKDIILGANPVISGQETMITVTVNNDGDFPKLAHNVKVKVFSIDDNGNQEYIGELEYGTIDAQKDYYPDIMLGVSLVETDEALMPGVADSGKDPIVAMIGVNLPIWRGKYHAAEREARFRKAAVEENRDDTGKRLDADLQLVLHQYRDAERKIDLYRDTLVPKAEQSLKVTQQGFEAGSTSFISLIDARRLLLEFQLAHQRAQADRGQRLAEIEMLTGREIGAGEL